MILPGLLGLTAWGWLAWASRALDPVPLTAFFAAIAVATVAMLWAHRAASVRAIVAWALVFRVAAFLGQPLYEDDFYRYLWEGRVVAQGGNPYVTPPSDAFGDDTVPEPFQRILDRVNYPDIPTVYGPVCQFAFAASYWIAPGELWPFRLILLAADLLTMFLVFRLLEQKRNLVFYAWSPLVIKEIGLTAHSDMLWIALALGAIDRLRAGRNWSGGALLGLSAAAKVFAWLLVPFLLIAKSRRQAVIALALAFAASYAPFLRHGGGETQGLGTFLRDWEFNSLGFAAVRSAAGGDAARWITLALFAVAAAWMLRDHARRDPLAIPRGDLIFGVFFLLAPVVNPWYLAAIAPFAALQPMRWSLTAMTMVMVSYATGMNLGRPEMGLFDHPDWVRPLEVAPVLVAAAIDWRVRSEDRASE